MIRSSKTPAVTTPTMEYDFDNKEENELCLILLKLSLYKNY